MDRTPLKIPIEIKITVEIPNDLIFRGNNQEEGAATLAAIKVLMFDGIDVNSLNFSRIRYVGDEKWEVIFNKIIKIN